MKPGSLRSKAVLIGLSLLWALLILGDGRAAVTNDECMGCHGEKEMTGKGPGGKTISLFFDMGRFGKSVHSSLQCVQCHEVSEVPHPEKLKVRGCNSCHGDVYRHYRAGAHGEGKVPKTTCRECHGYHDVAPADTLTNALCARCHGTVYHDYETSIHAHSRKAGKEVASCEDCHGKTHDLLRKNNPRSPVYERNIPAMCSRCHSNPEMVKKYSIPAEKAYALYLDSIHGQALTKSGVLVSAACSDCHGSHGIKPRTDPASTVNRARVAATCGKCHEDEKAAFQKGMHGREVQKGNPGAPGCATCHPAHEIRPVKTTTWMLEAIRECGSCHKVPLETYRHSYHGKITNLGFTRVAKCADCHGAHDVLPRSDPRSRISEQNILATCRQCHPGADKGFTQFVVHADYHSTTHHPIFRYVWLFMTALLICVFGFFGIHAALWLPRSWIERFRKHGKRGEE